MPRKSPPPAIPSPWEISMPSGWFGIPIIPETTSWSSTTTGWRSHP
jgi:hypothetical protein